VAKFHGDRPRDIGDLALKEEKRKERHQDKLYKFIKIFYLCATPDGQSTNIQIKGCVLMN